MNTIDSWAACVNGFGFNLDSVGEDSCRISLGGDRFLLVEQSGDPKLYRLTGSRKDLEHLAEIFPGAQVGDSILCSPAQVGNRLEEACRYALTTLVCPGVRERSAPSLQKSKVAALRACKDLISDEGTEAERVVKARRGQNLLSDILYAQYGRCFVTGLSVRALLVASHIKPWSDCKGKSAEERLDEDNVLLLSVAYDKLFDRGYISFEDNGDLMVDEDAISRNELMLLGVDVDVHVHLGVGYLTIGRKKYLEYHRKHVFGKKFRLPNDGGVYAAGTVI